MPYAVAGGLSWDNDTRVLIDTKNSCSEKDYKKAYQENITSAETSAKGSS